MSSEDKIILILFSSLFLLVFLDEQAKKQQTKIRNDVKKISIEELTSKQNFVEENVLKKPKEVIEDSMKAFEKYPSLKDLKEKLKIVLPMENSKTILYLYYPRFFGKETQMYRITKKINGEVTIDDALKLLQKGTEKGFVNAFYDSIKLENIKYDSTNKRIHLIFDDSFISNNKIVMQDRIDQICLVLKQFKEINEIYYWVNESLLHKETNCKREVFIRKE